MSGYTSASVGGVKGYEGDENLSNSRFLGHKADFALLFPEKAAE